MYKLGSIILSHLWACTVTENQHFSQLTVTGLQVKSEKLKKDIQMLKEPFDQDSSG